LRGGILRGGVVLLWTIVGLLVLATPGSAEKVYLTDGRVLDGRFTMISSVEANPLNPDQGPGTSKPILLCDDDLTRTLVSKRLVQKIDPAPVQRLEQFAIKQPVAQIGAQVSSIGTILDVTKFDAFGRRTFSMLTNKGRTDVIQGLTMITPVWSRLEALQGGQPFLWDMRIATSSLPRDLLSKVLRRQISPKDPDQRLKLVRFYMQAERFPDAEAELKLIVADFPNLEGLDQQVKALGQLGAERILGEVETRRKAGQNHLAYSMLESFPTDNISGPVLQEVRDKLEEYRKIQERGEGTIKQIDALMAQVKDVQLKRQLRPLRDEITLELSFGTLDRLAPFRRLADDTDLLPEQRLALAVSGWLLGADDAVDNLQVALSLSETRHLVLGYLNEPSRVKRLQWLESMGSQNGASPKYVAKLLAHMKPPVATPAQTVPGYYDLEIHGIEDEPDVTYHVQLPPEYDPYVKYPTVVTLHGAGSTAEQQIDWWAGVAKAAPMEKPPAKVPPLPLPDGKSAPDDKPAASSMLGGMRLGQAARQGYIVIAPEWTKPHQVKYEYSAREVAAVLGSLRDASRRFSIDTDRVFLSGHSMGGDAAWDMGLAHPDLWAGVIPIVATADKYVGHYWPNANRLSMYFVSGELDDGRTATNAPQWDKYLTQARGLDMTLVEYQGRGHENFSDEVIRLFGWMGRKKRDFSPKEFSVVTLREWDNFFWSVELKEMLASALVDPNSWPAPRGTHALRLEVKANAVNGLSIEMRAAKVTVWLAPSETLTFDRPITVIVNGQRISPHQPIKPSLSTMLDDVRSRGDRQHPFWAKLPDDPR
jgi:predicted esterase